MLWLRVNKFGRLEIHRSRGNSTNLNRQAAQIAGGQKQLALASSEA